MEYIEKKQIGSTISIDKTRSAEETKTLIYANAAYSHILKRGAYTFHDFSKAIKNHFDMANPRTAEVVRTLECRRKAG
jgi:hypothetical protein